MYAALKRSKNAVRPGAGLALTLFSAMALGLTPAVRAAGTWSPVTAPAPEAISTMLLLTDGRVLAQGNDDNTWYSLTPNAAGSYAGGTWKQLASMHYSRLYYGSAVLSNGKVLVGGGEYSSAGSETNTAEIYDPIANSWKPLPTPKYSNGNTWSDLGDAPTKIIPDGRLLIGDILTPATALFSISTNTWTPGANKADRCNEESWALLPNGSVFTINCIGAPSAGPDNAERFVPSVGAGAWVNAGTTPPGHFVVEGSSEEIGPALLLPSGNVLNIGATGHTAVYLANGTFQAGPDLPLVKDVDSSDQGSGTSNTYNTLVPAQAKDSSGCVLVNGKILFIAGATGYSPSNGGYPGGQYFFEYDPATSGVTSAPAPSGNYDTTAPAYVTRMLALPNGQALLSNGASNLFVYTPDGSGPDPAWKPTIKSLSPQTNAAYKLTGTQLNGLSEGAYYGDDAQMASNYPIVRVTDSLGNVSYARTFSHSTMGVATGNTLVSTYFVLPATVKPGNYTLEVVANGIASDTLPFTLPTTLAAFSISPNKVHGGTSSVGTVTLNAPAPSPLTVTLSSNNAAASVPPSVVVPMGATSATFPITTVTVTASTYVVVTAKQGTQVRTAAIVVD